ncbi:hypothetical protein GCM10009646_29750 [Streptomyces aureus]
MPDPDLAGAGGADGHLFTAQNLGAAGLVEADGVCHGNALFVRVVRLAVLGCGMCRPGMLPVGSLCLFGDDLAT